MAKPVPGGLLAPDAAIRPEGMLAKWQLSQAVLDGMCEPVPGPAVVGMPTSRAIYRYFRDVGDAGIDTLYLSLADHLATRGTNLLIPQWEYHTNLVAYVLKEHLKQKKTAPLKLIDGNDLIDVFGMKPGAKMGELLESIREAQATGELTTREEALDYVKKYLA